MTAAAAHFGAPDVEIHTAKRACAGWDAYVRSHKNGAFFHLSGWGEVIENTYGYEPVFITAHRNGVLAGVLQLTDVRAPLLGRSLIATAFTVGGGPLADDEEVERALLETASSIGAERSARYVECRTDGALARGWRRKEGVYAGFRLNIPADETENLNMLPRKRRAEVRKALAAAEEGALSVRFDGDGKTFYDLYARSLHALGTPVFPKRFLDETLRVFDDAVEIAIVEHRGVPVAGLVSFTFKDSVMPYYVGAAPEARALRAYDFLYWSVMRRASRRGATIFDFGRSKVDSGSYAYKKLWGAEAEPMTYRIKLIASGSVPNINPANPKFAAFARAWPYLPLPVANTFGPLLAPNFP